jgi:polar amino acid transport system substrate-binding protein
MRETADQNSSPKPAWALSLAALLFAAATLGSGTARAQDPVAIAIDENYPPYMFAEDGKPAGLYTDLISGAFERMDMPLTIEAMAWTAALQRIDGAEIGLGGLYKNDARLEKYDYSDAILEEKLMVFVRSGDEFAFDSLDDLRGRVVGVISGWSYGQAIDEARASGLLTTEEATSDGENLMKLLAGEIDAAIVDALAARTIIAGHDELKGTVIALPKPVATNMAYLAFNKDAHRQSLLEDFDATLSGMRADGSFETILSTSLDKNAAASAN